MHYLSRYQAYISRQDQANVTNDGNCRRPARTGETWEVVSMRRRALTRVHADVRGKLYCTVAIYDRSVTHCKALSIQ